MANRKKKKNGGCLTIILILAAIGGIGSLFGNNKTSTSNMTSSSYSPVTSTAVFSSQFSSSPKATIALKPTSTTTKTPTSTPKKPAPTPANGKIVYNGTYDSKNRPYNGSINYESNGAKVERNVVNGQLSKELVFVSNDIVVTGLLSEKNTIDEVTIVYANGDKYKGHLVNGKKRGQGKYYWTNGAWYEGSWYNDTMSGKGKYYFTSDSSRYYLEGNFIKGVPNGTLTYVSEKGISYTSLWNNGKCISVERK